MIHSHPAVFYGQLSATSTDDNRPVLMRNNDGGNGDYHNKTVLQTYSIMPIKQTSIAAENLWGLKK